MRTWIIGAKFKWSCGQAGASGSSSGSEHRDWITFLILLGVVESANQLGHSSESPGEPPEAPPAVEA